jgi:hypothetical protein
LRALKSSLHSEFPQILHHFHSFSHYPIIIPSLEIER